MIVALCPECNEDEKSRYGSASRDYVNYNLGGDAFYTGQGTDGKGDRGWGRRGAKVPKENVVKGNGILVKRSIEGVTWQYDDGYYAGR